MATKKPKPASTAALTAARYARASKERKEKVAKEGTRESRDIGEREARMMQRGRYVPSG